MKKKITLYLVIILVLGIGVASCVDGKDFDFDRMAQSTVNPNIHLNNLLSTEVSLSDFFNLDSIADSINNLELVTVNHPDGDYLDFIFSIDTVLVLDIPKLNNIAGVNFDLPSISIGDPLLNHYGAFHFPSISQPMDMFTVDIPKFDNRQTLDSIVINSGSIIFALSSNINHTAYMNMKCNGLRNRVTNKTFNKTFILSDSTQSGINIFNHQIDLSEYTLVVSSDSKLNFEQRVTIYVNGAILPNYDINLNLQFSDLELNYIYGKLSEYSFDFSDIINVDIFNDPDFAQIFEAGKFSLEDMYLDLNIETNMGLPTLLNLTTIKAYNENNNTSANIIPPNENSSIAINAASGHNRVGTANNKITLNSSALNTLPTKIEYKGDLLLNPNGSNGFIPNNPWTKAEAKIHIPLKAQINDLDYEIEFDRIDLGDATDYINSASLILNLTNYFPFSIGAQLFCIDANGIETGQVLELNNANNNTISGANVDSHGNIISPSTKTTKITITASNFDIIKNANKMKLKLLLNTSSSDSNKPYIRLNKDSKVSVSLGIDLKTNITF